MFQICDMIKGNKSLVEHFYLLAPLSHNFKILHFDANPIKIDIGHQRYDRFVNAQNNIKQWNLSTVFASQKQRRRHPTHVS